MSSKQVRSRARRRIARVAGAVGLVAITAVAASSIAGATPFIPTVPGAELPGPVDGTAVLDETTFPIQYASAAISGGNCLPTGLQAGCRTRPELFTLTKPVDRTTPILAVSAADGRPYRRAVITVRRAQNGAVSPLITYTLMDVRVIDDHQVFDTQQTSAGTTGTLREVVTLSYNTIEWSVGTTKAGYDWATNKKL